MQGDAGRPPPEHAGLALSNMGLLLYAMGKLEEARPLLKEDLQASRATLGDRHPETLRSISNMGGLLQDMGKREEARPLCEEALQARTGRRCGRPPP